MSMITMNGVQSLTIRKSKHRLRSSSTPIYDSPLTCFKKSPEFTSITNDIMSHKRKSLTRSTSRKLGGQNANVSGINSSRSNIIVINSDNEINDTNKEDASLSIIECSTSESISSPYLRTPQNKKLLSLERKSKRPSIIPLDNESSSVKSSSVRESLNGENIAPPAEDDVVELWSCLGNVKVDNNNESRTKKCSGNVIPRKQKFVIDTKPNMKNLECLKAKTAPARKKRKICDGLGTTALPLGESMMQITLERSKESRKKRYESRCNNNNTNLKLACSDVKCSRRKLKNIELGEVAGRFESTTNSGHKLREIIVDGCNVAMMHTYGQEFSEKGIKLVVDYFKSRGHVVKVFLPNHVRRKKYFFLEELYKEGTVVFTPSRCINGKNITPYDDRYILEYATKCKGIVISSDQYRDLFEEKPEWRDTIINRLLMPTFVGDYIMFPEDPLGKFGPKLQTFLQH